MIGQSCAQQGEHDLPAGLRRTAIGCTTMRRTIADSGIGKTCAIENPQRPPSAIRVTRETRFRLDRKEP